jgi:hypothetical protein
MGSDFRNLRDSAASFSSSPLMCPTAREGVLSIDDPEQLADFSLELNVETAQKQAILRNSTWKNGDRRARRASLHNWRSRRFSRSSKGRSVAIFEARRRGLFA